MSVKGQVTQTQCSRVPRIVCTGEEVGVGTVPPPPSWPPRKFLEVGRHTRRRNSCLESWQPHPGCTAGPCAPGEAGGTRMVGNGEKDGKETAVGGAVQPAGIAKEKGS